MSSNPNPKNAQAPATGPVIPAGAPRSTVTTPIGTITRVGIEKGGVGDLYHVMLTTSWPGFIGLIVVFYGLVNVLFGVVYTFTGGIENARAHNFEDAFFFSAQTFGTIGYGKMSPISSLANSVATAESLTGLIGVALMTGLIFAKFSRPTARVMWSKVMVVAPRDGFPTLMFRVANQRTNSIVDAQFRLSLLMDEVSAEGERLRRFHDLELVRGSTPALSLTFTVMHRIKPGTLLEGKTPEDLKRMNAQFVCSLIGLDDMLNATVHARASWRHDDVRWGNRFVDILSAMRDGSRLVDYTRFHDVEPVP